MNCLYCIFVIQSFIYYLYLYDQYLIYKYGYNCLQIG